METTIFDSSNLNNGYYDPDSKTLGITFNTGSTYEYMNVPPHVWSELCSASSAGSYFSSNIRNVYPYEQV